MGLANQFNDIIQKDLNAYAAWLPITQNYELGDYGLIADGVFAKLGNVKEFNVSFEQSTGPSAKIDYKSDRSRVIKFAGGAEVNVIPENAIDAKVVVKFENAKSFLIKSPNIRVKAIGNVQQLAEKLKQAKGWQKKWKVVYETYHAEDAVIISTVDANTEVSFAGEAAALEKLNLGNVNVDFGVNAGKQLGLDIQGKEGVIGLGLFKLKLIGGNVRVLSESDRSKPVEVEYLKTGSTEEDL